MNKTQIKILVLILLFFTIKEVYANVGGVTPKPGLIGDPIVWEFTNISIESEDLDLKFFEKNGKKFCSFSATYYLSSDTIGQIPISAIFYGLNASNINIFYNSIPLTTQIDSNEFKRIDSLIFTSTKQVNHRAVWYDWSKLNKKGFKFIYKSNAQNILKITGQIELKPTKMWYGVATPAIYAKHPFLNKSISERNELFHYLITPIETWKSVGEIRINIEYPEQWLLSYENQPEKILKNSNNTIIENIVLKDSIPKIFSINIHKKQKIFHIGGGSIGFSRIGKDDFATRLGWEFGIYHGVFINTLIAVEYETDYTNYNQISLTVIPTTPWLTLIWPNVGLGVGVPVRFVENKVYSGIRLRADFSWSLFNISLNMDYLPNLQNNRFNRTFYGATF